MRLCIALNRVIMSRSEPRVVCQVLTVDLRGCIASFLDASTPAASPVGGIFHLRFSPDVSLLVMQTSDGWTGDIANRSKPSAAPDNASSGAPSGG
jgi:hypothetical protein